MRPCPVTVLPHLPLLRMDVWGMPVCLWTSVWTYGRLRDVSMHACMHDVCRSVLRLCRVRILLCTRAPLSPKRILKSVSRSLAILVRAQLSLFGHSVFVRVLRARTLYPSKSSAVSVHAKGYLDDPQLSTQLRSHEGTPHPSFYNWPVARACVRACDPAAPRVVLDPTLLRTMRNRNMDTPGIHLTWSPMARDKNVLIRLHYLCTYLGSVLRICTPYVLHTL